MLKFKFWWYGGGDTPDLIPNSEVKLSCGDDTLMEGKVASRQNLDFNSIKTAYGQFLFL